MSTEIASLVLLFIITTDTDNTTCTYKFTYISLNMFNISTSNNVYNIMVDVDRETPVLTEVA